MLSGQSAPDRVTIIFAQCDRSDQFEEQTLVKPAAWLNCNARVGEELFSSPATLT